MIISKIVAKMQKFFMKLIKLMLWQQSLSTNC